MKLTKLEFQFKKNWKANHKKKESLTFEVTGLKKIKTWLWLLKIVYKMQLNDITHLKIQFILTVDALEQKC